MNSIQSALISNPESITAEIALLIMANSKAGKLLIVVEGWSDKDVYSRFYSEENFQVHNSTSFPGCQGLVEMTRKLNIKYLKRFIVIKDADFNHLDGISYSDIPNLFLTDTHDIETMMLTDGLMKQIELDYNITEIKDKVNNAANEIKHLSYIKWMNEKLNTGLNFKKSCKIGSCYDGNKCVSIEQWLNKINSYSANVDKKHFTEKDILEFEDHYIISSDKIFQLVCGHDIVDAITQKIRFCCKKNVSKQYVANVMRKCFTEEFYKKTILCNSINSWLYCHNCI